MAEHKLSAVLELKDKYSATIKNTTTATKAFSKETEQATKKVGKEWLGIGSDVDKGSKAAASGFKTIEKGATQAATVLGRNKTAFNGFVRSAGSAGKQAGNALKDGVVIGAKGISGALGGVMKGVGMGLGLGVFSSITGTISSAIGTAKNITKQGFLQFVDLEDKLVRNAGIMGISDDSSRVQAMTKQVRSLGAATEYTALQVADVHKYFAMAGWDSKNIETVAPSVLKFASATGTELGSAADIVSDYLTALGMKPEEVGKLMDVMGQGSLSSNQTIGMMAEAFKHMAPASGGRDSVEDLAIISGLLANQGIKGGEAGTYYKNTLSKFGSNEKGVNEALKKVGATAYRETTYKGKNVKIRKEMVRKSTLEIMKEVNQGLGKLNVKEQDKVLGALFGTMQSSRAKALLNSIASEDFPRLTEAIYNSNGAMDKLYEYWKNNSAKYKIEMLSSAYDEFKNRLGEAVKPEAMKWIEKATQYLDGDTFSTKNIENFFKTAIAYSYDFVETLKEVGTAVKTIGKGVEFFWNAGKTLGKGAAMMLYGEDAVRREEVDKELKRMKSLDEEGYKKSMDEKIKSGELYQLNKSGILGGGKVDARDVLDGKVKGMTDTASAEERIWFAEKKRKEYFEWLAIKDRKKLEEDYRTDFVAQEVLKRTAPKENPLLKSFGVPLQAPLFQNQEPVKAEHDINVNPIQINLNIKNEVDNKLLESFVNKRLGEFKTGLADDIVNAVATQS